MPNKISALTLIGADLCTRKSEKSDDSKKVIRLVARTTACRSHSLHHFQKKKKKK